MPKQPSLREAIEAADLLGQFLRGLEATFGGSIRAQVDNFEAPPPVAAFRMNKKRGGNPGGRPRGYCKPGGWSDRVLEILLEKGRMQIQDVALLWLHKGFQRPADGGLNLGARITHTLVDMEKRGLVVRVDHGVWEPSNFALALRARSAEGDVP